MMSPRDLLDEKGKVDADKVQRAIAEHPNGFLGLLADIVDMTDPPYLDGVTIVRPTIVIDGTTGEAIDPTFSRSDVVAKFSSVMRELTEAKTEANATRGAINMLCAIVAARGGELLIPHTDVQALPVGVTMKSTTDDAANGLRISTHFSGERFSTKHRLDGSPAFIVVKRGYYLHDVAGPFFSETSAKVAAQSLALREPDDHHSFDVCMVDADGILGDPKARYRLCDMSGLDRGWGSSWPRAYREALEEKAKRESKE